MIETRTEGFHIASADRCLVIPVSGTFTVILPPWNIPRDFETCLWNRGDGIISLSAMKSSGGPAPLIASGNRILPMHKAVISRWNCEGWRAEYIAPQCPSIEPWNATIRTRDGKWHGASWQDAALHFHDMTMASLDPESELTRIYLLNNGYEEFTPPDPPPPPEPDEVPIQKALRLLHQWGILEPIEDMARRGTVEDRIIFYRSTAVKIGNPFLQKICEARGWSEQDCRRFIKAANELP